MTDIQSMWSSLTYFLSTVLQLPFYSLVLHILLAQRQDNLSPFTFKILQMISALLLAIYDQLGWSVLCSFNHSILNRLATG